MKTHLSMHRHKSQPEGKLPHLLLFPRFFYSNQSRYWRICHSRECVAMNNPDKKYVDLDASRDLNMYND